MQEYPEFGVIFLNIAQSRLYETLKRIYKEAVQLRVIKIYETFNRKEHTDGK